MTTSPTRRPRPKPVWRVGQVSQVAQHRGQVVDEGCNCWAVGAVDGFADGAGPVIEGSGGTDAGLSAEGQPGPVGLT